MLARLSIQNLAIIDNLTLDFDDGFTVLTGETGAGKSIIIGALNLVLGERSSADDIRTGCDTAVIEALFDISACQAVQAVLRSQGICNDAEEVEPELVIHREISRQGRGKCLVNGRLVTVGQLKEIGDLLVDLHGQHQHQSLLKNELHREILDSFGADTIAKPLENYRKTYDQWREVIDRLRALDRDEREVERQKGLIQYQLDEIREAELEPEEDRLLEEEKGRLQHVDSLKRNTAQANDLLYEGETQGLSIIDLLGQCEQLLEQCVALDGSLAHSLDQLASARAQVEDMAVELGRYADALDADPERLTQVEDRLHLIRRLRKKYGATIEDILAEADRLETELHSLTHAEEEQGELDHKRIQIEAELVRQAEGLTRLREKAGKSFAGLLKKELVELEMPKVEFAVEMSAGEEEWLDEEDKGEESEALYDAYRVLFPDGKSRRIYPWGVDVVEFMISPNRGESLKPLRRIASGGELSRLMLALKVIMGDREHIPTLIFDEIDTGISGKTGMRVGEKMAGLGRDFQLICITHLAQIAARASHHFAVSKAEKGKRTLTHVEGLEPEARVIELARLLGGETDSAIAREHARALLDGSTLTRQ
ncbi:MAG: DNA repair protein RecN [Candidatus Sumerlaeia bacterium]